MSIQEPVDFPPTSKEVSKSIIYNGRQQVNYKHYHYLERNISLVHSHQMQNFYILDFG